MRATLPPQNPAIGDPIALRQISQGAREALQGNIVFQGALQLVPKLITDADSPYSVVASAFIAADTTAGAVTITLPPVANARGYVYFIKKADSSANALTLDGNGNNIDGAATKSTTTAWGSFIVACDGTQWLTF